MGETEARAAQTEALRAVLAERREDALVGEAESRRRTDAMISRKRAALGLDG